MTAAELFVKCLEAEGVEYIFGLPGEENLDFLEALRTSKTIQFVVCRHEQAAGFMAAAYGRLTGKPGVCLSTLGPGATNFVTAAAYAFLGGMPMIMLTGQKPIRFSKQGAFQIIDIVSLMRPVTKLSKQITHGDLIPTTVRESFKIASEERPGPVLLELPQDVARDVTTSQPLEVTKVRRPVAEVKAINLALELLKKAQKPMLVIGAGANRKLTSNMLTEFVNFTKIPFITTQMGKGVINETLTQYLGTTALSADDGVHHLIDEADLIINVGHDVYEKPPFIMRREQTRKVIHLHFYPAKLDDLYFPQLEVVGDIANAIWQMLEVLKQAELPKWNLKDVYEEAERLLARETKRNNETAKMWSKTTKQLKPQEIVKVLREVRSANTVFSLDNGMYKLWLSRNLPALVPNSVLLDNALATMGAGLPVGIAAKLVQPDKDVIVVTGDGGLMMNSQELETAVRLGLDMVVLLLNDNGYGMIKWEQDHYHYPRFGLNFTNPDFKLHAESYGCKYSKPTNSTQLYTALNTAIAAKGITIIEVPTDYSSSSEDIRLLKKL